MYIGKQVTFNTKKLHCWQALICQSNYFVPHHNAIQLNERSPEQFETIKHMNRRNETETLGNVL